jgi:PAS domain-containing protein
VRLLSTEPVDASDDASCDGMCALMTTTDGPLVVPDARADPRLHAVPAVADGRVGAFLGVPLVGERGAVLGVLCGWEEEPRDWTDADVELLGQLARSGVAELELAALSGEYQGTLDRWELAIDAAGVGSFDWDLTTGELLWDDPLLAIFWYGKDEFGRTSRTSRRACTRTTSRGSGPCSRPLARSARPGRWTTASSTRTGSRGG